MFSVISKVWFSIVTTVANVAHYFQVVTPIPLKAALVLPIAYILRPDPRFTGSMVREGDPYKLALAIVGMVLIVGFPLLPQQLYFLFTPAILIWGAVFCTWSVVNFVTKVRVFYGELLERFQPGVSRSSASDTIGYNPRAKSETNE